MMILSKGERGMDMLYSEKLLKEGEVSMLDSTLCTSYLKEGNSETHITAFFVSSSQSHPQQDTVK